MSHWQRVDPEPTWTSEQAQHTAPDSPSLAPPRRIRMRGDGAEIGLGCADAHTHTHAHRRIRLRSGEVPQHSSGRQSTPRDPRFHLVLVTTMERRTATTSNGSKSFDPKPSSTRVVAVPQSMASAYHTRKIDSESTGMKAVTQKRYSPAVILSVM